MGLYPGLATTPATADENFVPERSVFIILRDFEQRDLHYSYVMGDCNNQHENPAHTLRERALLDRTLIQLQDGVSIPCQKTQGIIQGLYKRYPQRSESSCYHEGEALLAGLIGSKVQRIFRRFPLL